MIYILCLICNINNKTSSRNIRDKKVPVGTKNIRNISHPTQNLYNKNTRINILSTKKLYIRGSTNIISKNNSKTSNLPSIKSTDKQKTNNNIILKNNLNYKKGKQKLLNEKIKSCYQTKTSSSQRTKEFPIVDNFNTNIILSKKKEGQQELLIKNINSCDILNTSSLQRSNASNSVENYKKKNPLNKK